LGLWTQAIKQHLKSKTHKQAAGSPELRFSQGPTVILNAQARCSRVAHQGGFHCADGTGKKKGGARDKSLAAKHGQKQEVREGSVADREDAVRAASASGGESDEEDEERCDMCEMKDISDTRHSMASWKRAVPQPLRNQPRSRVLYRLAGPALASLARHRRGAHRRAADRLTCRAR
jgi:hypothetical protein